MANFTNIPRPTQPPPRAVPPNPRDFPMPSRNAYDTSGFERDMGTFRGEVLDPRSSGAFRTGMALTGQRGNLAYQQGVNAARQGAARRGFTGGYSGVADDLLRERQQDAATAGFQAADDVRRSAGALYTSASGNYASMLKAYTDAVAQRNTQYFDALNRARLADLEAQTAWQGQQANLFATETTAATQRGGIQSTADTAAAALAEQRRQAEAEGARRAWEYAHPSAESTAALHEQKREFNIDRYGTPMAPTVTVPVTPRPSTPMPRAPVARGGGGGAAMSPLAPKTLSPALQAYIQRYGGRP